MHLELCAPVETSTPPKVLGIMLFLAFFHKGPAMVNPKIIFFDIDDTLYRKKSDFLPPSLNEVFRRLHDRHIRTAIASGRSPAVFPQQVNQLIRDQSIDLTIAINGQYIRRGDRVISYRTLPQETLSAAVKHCRDQGLVYCFVGAEAVAVSEDNPMVNEALAYVGPYLVDADYHRRQPVCQLLVFVSVEREGELQPLENLGLRSVRWHENSVDLLPRDASKARAIRELCADLAINPQETMAFGDGLNDLEMADAVGFFVAMGDGHPQLRTRADFLAPPVEEDGILRALEALKVI